MNAGEIAEELVGLILSDCEELDEDGRRIVANRIVADVSAWQNKAQEPPKVLPVKPMTDEEARAYGRTSLSFGKHQGTAIDQLPLRYLEWLADVSRQTAVMLSRYLNSPRIKMERQREDASYDRGESEHDD